MGAIAAEAAAIAFAGCAEEGVQLSANLAVVTDYRSRGLSYSNEEAAIQGGFDVAAPHGWSAGVWTSTIDEWRGSTEEIDVYFARSFSLGSSELSLGATAFVFPNGEGANLGEIEASLARTIGPIDATLALAYAWEQANLGEEDNLYLSLDGTAPLGRLAGAPLAISGSIGYEEGPFAIEGAKVDGSLSVSADIAGVAIGVSYVYTDIENEIGEPGWLMSISRTF